MRGGSYIVSFRPLVAGVLLATAVGQGSAARAAATGGGVEDCSNGVDDNGNGLVDCADLKQCRFDPACTEAGDRCDDGLDNDQDGATDCADPECATALACVEVGDRCADGIDNDGDGSLDCEDVDCASFVLCSADICLDPGTPELAFYLVIELANGELKSARCTTVAGTTSCQTAGTGANGRPLLVLGPPMCGGTP